MHFLRSARCLFLLVIGLKTINYSVSQLSYAFYNVYAQGPTYESIVREQLHVLNASGLYDRLSSIFYVTIGSNSSSYIISSAQKFVKLAWLPNGTEVDTLLHLYNFCRQTKSDRAKVLYFHNKGSYHTSQKNDEFRRALDCFNLTPHCIAALGKP